MLVTVDIPQESVQNFRALCSMHNIEILTTTNTAVLAAIRGFPSPSLTLALLQPWASSVGVKSRYVTMLAWTIMRSSASVRSRPRTHSGDAC